MNVLVHVGKFTRKHDQWGPINQALCIFDQQNCRALCNHVRSALKKKKKGFVANLSAKRQLSVAKLSTERIFSLAISDWLVANGRMAADFSSACNGMFFLLRKRPRNLVPANRGKKNRFVASDVQ